MRIVHFPYDNNKYFNFSLLGTMIDDIFPKGYASPIYRTKKLSGCSWIDLQYTCFPHECCERFRWRRQLSLLYLYNVKVIKLRRDCLEAQIYIVWSPEQIHSFETLQDWPKQLLHSTLRELVRGISKMGVFFVTKLRKLLWAWPRGIFLSKNRDFLSLECKFLSWKIIYVVTKAMNFRI